MKLSDLFVSYKQVEAPKQEQKSFDLPMDKYQRFLEYVNSRKEAKKDDKKTESTSTMGTADEFGFEGWSTAPTSSSSTTSSKAPSTSQTGSPNPAPQSTFQESSKSTPKWSSPYTNLGRDKWIEDMINAYKKAGLSTNAIKNLLAKNALESGWGKSAQGSYNFGNLTTGKHWQGKYVDGKDHDSNGNQISNRFRAYDSLDDYVKDEIQFLTRLYEFDQNDDINTFLNKLQGGNSAKRKYAGDKQYVNRVRSVYNGLKWNG